MCVKESVSDPRGHNVVLYTLPMLLTRVLVILIPFVALACTQTTKIAQASSSEVFKVRQQYLEVLVGSVPASPLGSIATRLTVVGTSATTELGKLDITRTDGAIFSDLTDLNDSAQMTLSAFRLRVIALGLVTPGSSLENDAEALTKLANVLPRFISRYANAGQVFTTLGRPIYGNWWDWEIGTPTALQEALLLLGDKIAPEIVQAATVAVATHSPDPTRFVFVDRESTAANRVWKSTVTALRGILTANQAGQDWLAVARDALTPVFDDVTSFDGFYKDGSFVQHEYYAYTAGYGSGLLDDTAKLMFVLHGTPWQIVTPRHANIYRWVKESFAPIMVYGSAHASVRGRNVARGFSDSYQGVTITSSVLRLARIAPEGEAQIMRRMAARWISDDPKTFQARASLTALLDAETLSGVAPLADNAFHVRFSGMLRVVHHRPGWTLMLALNSRRIRPFESINGENLRGWYHGTGTTYLSTDEDRFPTDDGFWPTVDPYRMPGITVANEISSPKANGVGVYITPETWSGGSDITTSDGPFGAVGMIWRTGDIRGEAKVNAVKSWFLFNDEIVALGAGIQGVAGTQVETVVANRRLSATDALTAATPNAAGAITWAHISGMGGVVFPGGAVVKQSDGDRTGTWKDIHSKGSTTPISRRYGTLWLEHGTAPSNGQYNYIVLPRKTQQETSAYVSSNPITVLSNQNSVQAVRHTALGVEGYNFFAATDASPTTSEKLSVVQPCSVMLYNKNQTLNLSISDPTQTQNLLNLTYSQNVKVIVKDPEITVVSENPLKITVNSAGSLGKTYRISLQLQ